MLAKPLGFSVLRSRLSALCVTFLGHGSQCRRVVSRGWVVGTKVALLWGMKTTRCTICKTEGNHERYSYWTRPRAVCSSCHLANYSGQINAGYLNGKRLTDEQRRAFSVVVKP